MRLPPSRSFSDLVECNGFCQRAAKTGKLVLAQKWFSNIEANLLSGAMLLNKDLKFYCDDVFLRVENSETPFTGLYKQGEIIRMPITCKYGNYFADEEL